MSETYKVSLLMKLGNLKDKNLNARDTIEIYKDFCDKNGEVWFSTNALSSGISREKVDKFNDVILKENKKVIIYFVIGENAGGSGDIEYSAEVTEVKSSVDEIKCDNENLVPDQFKNEMRRIWIKLKLLNRTNNISTSQFVFESTKSSVEETLRKGQCQFGYIVNNDNLKTDRMHEVAEILRKECFEIRKNKKVISNEDLKKQYDLFYDKFNPEILRKLSGDDLLKIIFYDNNKDNLLYWLEYKNCDEFNTMNFGSIAGGSALKYIMYKSKDGKWITGKVNDMHEISNDDAVILAGKIRDCLVKGAEIIEGLSDNASIEDYVQLESRLNDVMEYNLSYSSWVHKYYHMIFRNKISNFHSASFQKPLLMNMMLKPYDNKEERESIYVLGGQFILLKNLININGENYSHKEISTAMFNVFGKIKNYYRIGTSDGTVSYFDEMKNDSIISIGWSELGDLNRFREDSKGAFIEKVKNELNRVYPESNPSSNGRGARDIAYFYCDMNIGDIVAACEGKRILGIGRVIGGYEYDSNREFAHIRKVKWIKFVDDDEKIDECLRTTCRPLKYTESILTIEKIMDGQSIETVTDILSEEKGKKLDPLTGLALKMSCILERKKQMILYGPPGTGKTYNAEKVALELCSRKKFNKSFGNLNNDERLVIQGGNGIKGMVRTCCFHPSYGYEDFIEGIKPSVLNGSVVFERKDGIFKELCKDAAQDKNNNYYIIIDEINRGDISRIFGELMMLIENSKRNKEAVLPLSNDCFAVPDNVFIIGTMNTADKSISSLDAALRRRFAFMELMPDYSLLNTVVNNKIPLDTYLKELNDKICENIGHDGRNLQIGHSYFMENGKPIDSFDKFKQILMEDIIPLIEEYAYGDYKIIKNILGELLVDVKNQRIKYEVFDEDDDTAISAILYSFPNIEINNGDIDEEEIDEAAIDGQENSGELV